MVDPPSAVHVPHLIGIELVSAGIAKTQVVAVNRTTGDRRIKSTDSLKLVIFDAADFISGYTVDDVIEFENVGASIGGATATITNALGGFQSVRLTAAAAPTVAVNL